MSTVRTAAVVGLGAAGTELARRLTGAGIRTIGVEPDPEAAARARRACAAHPIEVTAELSAVAAADLVLEAVPEPEPTKRAVLAAVAGHRRADALVVTTALSTPVGELADAAGGPLLALRFARADRLDAAEVARPPHTPDEVVQRVQQTLGAAGTTLHEVPDRPGSLAPGLLLGLLNQAAWMCHQGYVEAEPLETAVRLGCGWSDGPLAVLAAIGHRTAADILHGLHQRLGDRYAPAPLLSGPPLVPHHGAGHPTPDAPTEGASAAASDPAPEAAAPPRTVAVIGSGTMATGIAEVFLRAGLRTLLVARTDAKAVAAREAVEFGLLRTGWSDEQVATALERWSGRTELAAVADADLVVEAVVEDLAVKRQTFAALGALCRPGTVLATTTSALPVAACAAAANRPRDVLGLHFFNPAATMDLVELVRTEHTGPAALATARAALAAAGKVAVECGDRTGFVVNALLFPYLNDALTALADPGVRPALLDTVMKSVGGQPLGPTRLLDVVGADVALQVQRLLYESSGRPELAPADLLHRLVDRGYLGRKSAGRGVRALLTEEARAGVA
ncbi:3-hydroxyacyl-CoA dehydrogenase NAD-binding domain-containing protein [Streptomyces sp. 796.1]|uniref:3-hydroxyacyl-CoA dehydrogenase NAD-binding domain-containing protein n=1 Tax=Streptomyces sp. 796.1 TaxID=3163029 RepID=UPI0039C96A4A